MYILNDIMKELILYRKYEPKKLEDYIIVPRIHEMIKDGVLSNLVFHGKKGLGKTTLANLLTEGYPTLFIDASLNTNIDVLREDVAEFCSKSSITFGAKNKKFKYNEGMKFVILDEFERLSSLTMDALKGFIQNNDTHVRFIATTNHLHKVNNPELLSRFKIVNFNPIDDDEKNFMFKEYCKKVLSICNSENIKINADEIKTLVKRHFPDLRQTIISLIYVKQKGSISNEISDNAETSSNNELYDFITSDKNGLDVYNYVEKKYGDSRIHELFIQLGKPFMEYLCRKNVKYATILDSIIIETAKYMHMYNTTLDPMLIGVSLICEVKKILKTI